MASIHQNERFQIFTWLWFTVEGVEQGSQSERISLNLNNAMNWIVVNFSEEFWAKRAALNQFKWYFHVKQRHSSQSNRKNSTRKQKFVCGKHVYSFATCIRWVPSSCANSVCFSRFVLPSWCSSKLRYAYV